MRPVARWAQSRPACLGTADPKTTTGTSWNGAAHMDTEAVSPSSPAAGVHPRPGRHRRGMALASAPAQHGAWVITYAYQVYTTPMVPTQMVRTHVRPNRRCLDSVCTHKRYVFARQLGRRKGYGRVHCYGETARAWNLCKDSGRGWPGAAGHYRSHFSKMALQKSFLYMAGSFLS